MLALEHFQAKWVPVRRPEMRRTKDKLKLHATFNA
jgi:hypothetical protein